MKAGAKMRNILFIFLSTILLFSCTNVNVPNNNSKVTLENTTWKLVDISGDKIPAKTPNSGRFGDFTLELGTDRLHGISGINTFNGSYTVTGNKIETKGIMSTLMAGPENLMKLEGRYIKALNSMKSYRITNNKLVITADTDTLNFEKVE